jgi:flagellar biosynthesis/type III secretory pathway M-ring protein FliF/YscJ
VEYVVAIVVLAAVVAIVVAGPLRRGAGASAAVDDRREALEAAKEAKYREIRDAELDFRMGKLSEEDYGKTDRELRAQAIEILKQLDRVDATQRR